MTRSSGAALFYVLVGGVVAALIAAVVYSAEPPPAPVQPPAAVDAVEGYDRDLFGPSLSRADPDDDGCDVRNEILAAQLLEVVMQDGCLVSAGLLVDPYTGEREVFQRGTTTSRLVQIDHVYALRDAWDDGADAWTPEQRLAFATDPLNLVAATDNINASKGARMLGEWLPPLEDAVCPYTGRYLLVATKYGLELDVAAQAFAEDHLEVCGIQRLTVR